ncbi:HAD hydrolase family protein [Psychrobacter sp. 16-MNA-CIBAN-0192]|uniref:HAD hydrolase family protein n=1 Tax=Psychrobacter sp. 16-MNA-CIBAN-0192 TaxID=3140448 RepID=UPI003328A6BD
MTTTFFQPNLTIIKPYALMDLDDTLFQTQRKIDTWHLPTAEPENLVCATVNKQSEPLSFMSQRQATFFNWLLASTELIAVTARDTSEIKRVLLPLDSWQVLTHGAIILMPNGQPLSDWQQKISEQLCPLQNNLNQLIQLISEHHAQNDNGHNDLIFTMHTDCFHNKELAIYLAIKHAKKDHQALELLAKQLAMLIPDFDTHFYVHVNANNLAILPHAVHKQYAVQFLLEHHLDHARPSFGFGDSLADLPFLQLLDWYGMPSRGQLHSQLKTGYV